MDKILFVQPIFAPCDSLFQKNMDSIKSLSEYLKNNNSDVDLYFGGYCHKDEYFNEIKSFVENNFPNNPHKTVLRYDKNYGKSRIVNHIVSKYLELNPDAKFLFTCDSDMKFMDNQPKFFERLLLASVHSMLARKKDFGMISINQAGDNHHWHHRMDNSHTYSLKESFGIDKDEVLTWPSGGAGIAGGALFIGIPAWKRIGGYRQFNRPYASDDGYILVDMQNNNFSVCIIKTLKIFHPGNTFDENDYVQWKKEMLVDGRQFNSEISKQEIASSMKFWDERKIEME